MFNQGGLSFHPPEGWDPPERMDRRKDATQKFHFQFFALIVQYLLWEDEAREEATVPDELRKPDRQRERQNARVIVNVMVTGAYFVYSYVAHFNAILPKNFFYVVTHAKSVSRRIKISIVDRWSQTSKNAFFHGLANNIISDTETLYPLYIVFHHKIAGH